MQEDLPLLSYTATLHPKVNSESPHLFGVQHLSYTTFLLFKKLIEQGFDPKKIFLMGKCYSTNPFMLSRFKELGIQVASTSLKFDSHVNYDQTFSVNVKNFFTPLFQQLNNKKAIILDDGAELLKLANNEITASNLVAIEQTSSGFHKAQALNLNFPIINVARSRAKLSHETKFVARMICRKTKELLSLRSSYFPKILVIGAGPIGKTIYKYLRSNYLCDLYDIDPQKTKVIQPLNKIIGQYNVIIGSTGAQSINKALHSQLNPSTLLISASSSDREFDSVELRKQVPRYYNCHQNIHIGDITLVNSGFPINFDALFLDSYEFQLTRSLLFSAILQAIETSPSHANFIPLKNQRKIILEYLSLCAHSIQDKKLENNEIVFSQYPTQNKIYSDGVKV